VHHSRPLRPGCNHDASGSGSTVDCAPMRWTSVSVNSPQYRSRLRGGGIAYSVALRGPATTREDDEAKRSRRMANRGRSRRSRCAPYVTRCVCVCVCACVCSEAIEAPACDRVLVGAGRNASVCRSLVAMRRGWSVSNALHGQSVNHLRPSPFPLPLPLPLSRLTRTVRNVRYRSLDKLAGDGQVVRRVSRQNGLCRLRRTGLSFRCHHHHQRQQQQQQQQQR